MQRNRFTLHRLAHLFFVGLLLAPAAHAAATTPGIATGFHHSLALKADGGVWAWGYNRNGQLGDGSTVEKASPVQVLLPGSEVIQVAAGKIYSLALKADGSVWGWGNNAWGQMADGTKIDHLTPVQILPPGSDVIKIAAGRDFAFALKKDGSLWGWGFSDVFSHLGVAALLSVVVNAGVISYFYRREIQDTLVAIEKESYRMPIWVTITHLIFMALLVASSLTPASNNRAILGWASLARMSRSRRKRSRQTSLCR